MVARVYRQAGDRTLELDLDRREAAPEPRPIVVAVHGGSWQRGDSSQLPAINRCLAARGYGVAAINDRLAPQHVFPAARDDVVAAVRYLQSHAAELGLDADRVVLLGRSAGGQLALSAAYGMADPAVRGVVALYAPSDMNWSWENAGRTRPTGWCWTARRRSATTSAARRRRSRSSSTKPRRSASSAPARRRP